MRYLFRNQLHFKSEALTRTQVSRMNKKVTCKRLRPNPIFESWLLIMYKDAVLTGSHLQHKLKEALKSMKRYPLPLKSGAECIILKGFDKPLCAYFDMLINRDNNNDTLSKNCKSSSHEATDSENTIPKTSLSIRDNNSQSVGLSESPELASDTLAECYVNGQHMEIDNVQDSNTAPSVITKNTDNGKVKAKREGKKTGKYKPAHRSGGYAILVTLLEQSLENPEKSALTKEELIEKAQKHAEESFVRPKNDSFYTAWSSMATLQKKGLVTRSKGKKAKFTLTKEGRKLAREILEDAKNIPTVNDIIFKDVPSTSSASVQQSADMVINDEILSTSGNISPINAIDMAPGTFDIILLIDKNETSGLKKKNDPTVAQFNKYKDLKHEYRSLKVGDFAWIAKHEDQELVLPFIIERKRMDDLGASIKDGRFHEQKFRLHKCGIDNVIYMVENYGKNKHVGLPIQHLMQAIANTRVQDGFRVHVTDSLTNSARFLAMLTKRLTIRYKNKHLQGCNADPQGEMLMTFDYFNKSSAKNKPLTVTETFIKILLQLKGMSVDKALAITNKYPTPRSLIQAYVKCDRKEGETLLAYLKYGDLYRNVGPATSKSIYQLFSSSGAE